MTKRSRGTPVRGVFSRWVEINRGIPLGSALGPLLFLISANDMPKRLGLLPYLFADEDKVMEEVKSEEDCISLQGDINKPPKEVSLYIYMVDEMKPH